MFLLEPQGGDNYLLRAQSNPQAIPGGTIGTQLVQIPVQPGWLLGIDTDTGGVSGYITGDSSDVLRFYSNDIVGMSGMATTTLAGRVVNLTARLESDCDADGLGDDTQDPDISACNPPTPTTDTTAPDTTITKHPKDKTKKKQAVFEFSSSEAGSTFECALDGAAFAPCTSPDTLKVKKGKHSFNVRAKDAAGNVDGSPATDSWKVKKKRK
ncbi:MAG TPA: hypothetical protein VEK39_01635 [Solirubrobacterales bacterium]|nr:hypothetical protein [Solirubrobacterales bacterium]